jgi:hypothetical protein
LPIIPQFARAVQAARDHPGKGRVKTGIAPASKPSDAGDYRTNNLE